MRKRYLTNEEFMDLDIKGELSAKEGFKKTINKAKEIGNKSLISKKRR